MLSRVVSAGIVLAFVLYPLLAYFGLRHVGVAWIAAALVGICALRLLVLLSRGAAAPGGAAAQVWLVCGGGILLAAVSWLQRSTVAILFYPVLMNAAMLLIFVHSLVHPPTIVERIARLKDPTLSSAGVRYTRRVTMAWAVFFTFNGAIALYTALFGSFELWALYNGAIAYALIAIMFGGELVTRWWLKRRLVP